MRKWWIAFIAGAAVIGCTGGSGGSGTTGTTGSTGTTPTGRSVPTINLPNQVAEIQFLFLGGQGRRLPGSQFAVVNNLRLENGILDSIPTTFQGSSDGVRIQLDAYEVNRFSFTEPLPTNDAFKVYADYPLEIHRMLEEDNFGNIIPVFTGPPVIVDPPIAVNAMLMRGRQTSVPVKLNDGMLFWDNLNGVDFNRVAFELDNYDPTNNKILGYFTDMISFNLGGMATADRPTMINGNPADTVMFSGDFVAASSGFNSQGTFNLFGPAFIESGTIVPPVNLGGTFAPGSYDAYEPDPSVIPPASGLVQFLNGPWRAHTEVLGNLRDTNAVVFPTSNPNGEHQVVVWSQNGAGQVIKMWHGKVTFAAGNTTGTITIWSVDQLDNQTQANAATGTLSNLAVSKGMVLDGDITYTTTPAGFPFAVQGSFAVYR